jgi:hypothetical protein
MYLGSWKIDDLLTFPANTHSASTGAAADADSVPSYLVYEDETGTAILSGSMAKLDDANTTGLYSEQIPLSAANGFEVGKTYTVYITATVGGVTGTMSHTFQVAAATVQADVVSVGGVGAAADGLGSLGIQYDNEGVIPADVVAINNDLMAAMHAQTFFTTTGDIRIDGSVAQGGETITFETNLSETEDNKYVGWRFVYLGAGTNNAVTRIVEAYNGTTKAITLNRALPASTTLGHAFVLWSDEVLTQAGANAAADTALTDYDPPTKAELDAAQASIESGIGGVGAAATAILEDTSTTIPAQISGLNNISPAQVNAEVDTALADIHLDHLLANTYDPANKPGAADALLNELIGDDGGVSQFTSNALENAPSGSGATAQEVWEYTTRTLTQSAASVAAAVQGDRITVYRGTRWSITLTGLGNISALDRVYFSVKKSWRDSENDAMVRLRNGSNGLLRINKAAATSSSAGTLTINDAVTGSITITIAASETDAVVPDLYDYDIKGIDTNGDPVTMLAYGENKFVIKGDITQAIS